MRDLCRAEVHRAPDPPATLDDLLTDEQVRQLALCLGLIALDGYQELRELATDRPRRALRPTRRRHR